jgi:hypothetical protein
MAGTQNNGQHIIGNLVKARARMQMQDHLLLLSRTLDVRQQIANSIRHHPLKWVSSGFVSGWVLSRLPAREKKIYIDSANQKQVKDHDNMRLGKIWKVAWSTSKPLLAAYLAKKLAEKAKAYRSGTAMNRS